MILDGDDRLNVDHALSTLVEAYDRHACWMTYGSWVSEIPGRPSGMWPAYPDGIEDFRGPLAGDPSADVEEMALGPRQR